MSEVPERRPDQKPIRCVLVDSPDEMPVFADTLGTRFLSHPPIIPFTVDSS